MIWKIIRVLILIGLIIGGAFFIYQNLPGEPVDFIKKGSIDDGSINLNYGDTPVFMENLRFNHNNISFFIESSCSTERRESTREAFNIFEVSTGIINFREVGNSNADIKVGCSDNYIPVGETHFAAGEGGPSLIINTSVFKIIEEGKIALYRETACDYPVVELHELGHVFGFDHSPNPSNIMYNISNCNQRITPDMINIIRELYLIEPLPDAKIKEISVVKRGRYLDFNISIQNEGLSEIPKSKLTILTGGELVDKFELSEIKIGFGQSLQVTNLKLPSRSTSQVEFYLDLENKIREINENNNFVNLEIGPA